MKKIVINTWLAAALIPLACLALPTCSGPAVNEKSQTTFLTADDMIQMTDRMAVSIASNNDVAHVTAAKPMTIVLKPIINDTNEVIVGNEKQMYVARVRALLASKPQLQSRFTFVLNRDDYEKLLQTEGPDQLGPVEAAAAEQSRFVPDYALTGRFYAQTNATSRQRSDFYLCTFQLTNIATGQVLWEDTYETKKHIKKDLLD